MYLFNGIKYKIVGHQTLAVAASVVSPTLSGTNIIAMVVRVNTASLRWTATSAATPTASAGKTESVGAELLFDDRDEIDNFEAIRTGSTSSEIDFVFLAGVP